jgi:hypothetical protein
MQHVWGEQKWLKNFGTAITQKNEKVRWTLALQEIVEFILILYTCYNARVQNVLWYEYNHNTVKYEIHDLYPI